MQEKKQLEKIKQDNLQKDLRRIDREQVIGQQHKYAKPKKTAKKSYKEKEWGSISVNHIQINKQINH